MEDSIESNSLKDEVIEKESNTSLRSKVTEIHPLAFTIEFDDQKFDENRKSKVKERLSAFTLKHRRNPSLPEFRDVKNGKSCQSNEKIVSPVISKHVPILHRGTLKPEKTGKSSENQWKSTALKVTKNIELKSPLLIRSNLGMKDNFISGLKSGRRYSLDGIDDCKDSFQNVNCSNNNFGCGPARKKDEVENKSDTISEAGTYTLDKEDELENKIETTCVLQDQENEENEENGEYLNGAHKNFHNNWIKNWVRDVAEQNLHNPAPKEPPPIFSRSAENGNDSCETSKIPSPINTIGRKAKPRSTKQGTSMKLNGSTFHRRSSSLCKKDYNENRGSESSLETESFLKTTESVMTSMQNRMKLSIEKGSPCLSRVEKQNFNYKERPHPPSTASDTDTNSENETKTFKKPIGSPFTSARLNRAFSLRRAKADPEKDLARTKLVTEFDSLNSKQGQTIKSTTVKPPSFSPFSRLDCGRFSMRSVPSSIRPNLPNQLQKKESKKSNGGNRSTSSLSSREVEFQNWRRRKSFDPMKAAAEGRKKELAKKAAMNSLTQSVNLGNGPRTRSVGGNSVLRSASFHSTVQMLAGEEGGDEDFLEQGSFDDQESGSSSYPSNRHSLPHNSPTQPCLQPKPATRTSVFSSRSSLVSETHSSPSRRLKSNDLENLVLSAISEASYKLKLKSCKLLKKLNYLYDPDEEKSFKLRDEIAVLESGGNSAKNSPAHQTTSRELSAILKNLKGVENVFSVLEEVLFDENVEVYCNK